MKSLLAGVVLLVSCASPARYAYQETEMCPAVMSEQEHNSGVVRCRAMCSSYARDFAEFGSDCRCRCAPAGGGGYLVKPPQPRQEQRKSWSETLYTPAR